MTKPRRVVRPVLWKIENRKSIYQKIEYQFSNNQNAISLTLENQFFAYNRKLISKAIEISFSRQVIWKIKKATYPEYAY